MGKKLKNTGKRRRGVRAGKWGHRPWVATAMSCLNQDAKEGNHRILILIKKRGRGNRGQGLLHPRRLCEEVGNCRKKSGKQGKKENPKKNEYGKNHRSLMPIACIWAIVQDRTQERQNRGSKQEREKRKKNLMSMTTPPRPEIELSAKACRDGGGGR